ncbi:MAG: diadenylate cyclase CdaA [Clostridia bacterium]|nr:diadenylate cyclase CdaA [Clostridia bacterium]
MGEFLRNIYTQFISVFSTFSFWDALDILAVTFIIYMAIKLIRDTRAVQLIKGIIVFVVVYLIAKIFQLQLLAFIIQEVVLQWGVLAVIVLFQPEIRHALERMGRTKLANFITQSDVKMKKQADAIEPVCRACSSMSAARVGALIVFESTTPLADIAATGTMIDANAESGLIENIFYPKSPLHDGALIIRAGRLLSAGCILPLSSVGNISRELGTRHRAALGMSEESDAFVIVVSEETGAISYAYKSTLMRNISASDLRDVLSKTYVDNEDVEDVLSSGKNKLKSWFKGGKKNG